MSVLKFLWMEQDADNEDIMRGGEIQFKGNNETKQSHLMLVGKPFSFPVSYEFSVWSRGVGRISYSQLCYILRLIIVPYGFHTQCLLSAPQCS